MFQFWFWQEFHQNLGFCFDYKNLEPKCQLFSVSAKFRFWLITNSDPLVSLPSFFTYFQGRKKWVWTMECFSSLFFLCSHRGLSTLPRNKGRFECVCVCVLMPCETTFLLVFPYWKELSKINELNLPKILISLLQLKTR